MHPQLQERICTITGTSVQILQAGQQVLQKLQEGECRYANMTTNYSAVAGASMMHAGVVPMGYVQTPMYAQAALMQAQARMAGLGGAAAYGGYAAASQKASHTTLPAAGATAAGGTTVTITVPDAQVGCIVGKGGSTIQAMQAQTGAKMNVSQRDGPGGDRIVTISGDASAVANAQLMVAQKIQESSMPR